MAALLFTYYLRTVRISTNLVAPVLLAPLLGTRLPHYLKLIYFVTQAQVSIRSHGTQLTS
jgi:hypothetical protein